MTLLQTILDAGTLEEQLAATLAEFGEVAIKPVAIGELQGMSVTIDATGDGHRVVGLGTTLASALVDAVCQAAPIATAWRAAVAATTP